MSENGDDDAVDVDDDGEMVLPLHINFNKVLTLLLTPLQPSLPRLSVASLDWW